LLRQAKALECTDHIVDVTPLNGVIPAFSHTTLRLTFSPKQAAAQRGFTSKALLPEQQANSYNYLVQVGTLTAYCHMATYKTWLTGLWQLTNNCLVAL